MAKRVTLKAISERCGVSHVAVGAALGTLSGESRVRLSPEKAREIRRVADEMGYQENRLAQALRATRTQTVGVLFRVVSNPQQVNYLLDCLHRELQSRGYYAHLWPFHSSFELLSHGIRELAGWQVDGLLVSHLFASDDHGGDWPELEDWLAKIGLRTVLIESNLATRRDLPRVALDLEGAAATAARHLLELGHRRLAYVGTGKGRDASRCTAAREALHGCEGASVEQLRLAIDRASRPTIELVEAGMRLGAELAARDDRPTGYICVNDVVASSLATAFRQQGLAVPGAVSVVGFDNGEAALLATPPLTTFEPPMKQLAARAVEVLIEELDRGETTGPNERLAPVFIPGRSTAPPPA